MKRTSIWLILLAGVLVVAGVAGAQIGSSSDDQPYTNILELQKGKKYLIHASADVPVEVYVDVPEASPENILFFDSEGNQYSLPNRATVRLQGPVILGRADQTEEVAPPVVRWRYVNSMFSFSRSLNGRTLP